jgi:hypothetical protein
MRANMDEIEVSAWLPEGRYWARCIGAEPITGQYGDEGMELTWEAMAPKSGLGRTIRDKLWPTGKAAARLKLAARVLGIRDHGADVEITEKDFVGKECWIKVILGKPFVGQDGQERQYAQIAYDGYAAGDRPADAVAPRAHAGTAPAAAPAARRPRPPQGPAPAPRPRPTAPAAPAGRQPGEEDWPG